MSENFTPRERSAVEAAAYQATKYTQRITDADLVAVVEGLTGVPVAQTPHIDIAFSAMGDSDDISHLSTHDASGSPVRAVWRSGCKGTVKLLRSPGLR